MIIMVLDDGYGWWMMDNISGFSLQAFDQIMNRKTTPHKDEELNLFACSSIWMVDMMMIMMMWWFCFFLQVVVAVVACCCCCCCCYSGLLSVLVAAFFNFLFPKSCKPHINHDS